MQNDSTPRRHHYLPQFYLRGFTDKGYNGKNGRLRVLDFSIAKCYTSSPKNMANIRDYYTLVDNEGQPNYRVETELLCRIDSEAARVIREIEKTKKRPGRNDWLSLCEFVASLQVRIPHFRQANYEVAQHIFDIFAESAVRSPEDFQPIAEKYEAHTGKPLEVSFEQATQAVSSGELEIQVPRNQNVLAMMALIPQIAEIAAEMTPHLLVATGLGRFITGDIPIHKYDNNQDRRGLGLMGIGWASSDIEISIPLTKNTCLVLDRNEEVPFCLPANDFCVANCNYFRMAACAQLLFADNGNFPFLGDPATVEWGEERAMEKFCGTKNRHAISILGGTINRRPPKTVRR